VRQPFGFIVHRWVSLNKLDRLLEAIKNKTPSTQIVLTFFSPSGYDLRKNYALADLVCYLPFDFNDEVKRFVDKIRTKLM
jgi:3-deoxy-D-manno-octulosonic-acid transferase